MHTFEQLALLASGLVAGAILGGSVSDRAVAEPDIRESSGAHRSAQSAGLPISISVRCQGGLVAVDREVTVFGDGRMTVRDKGQLRHGVIAPVTMQALSARLDAAGFDNLASAGLPRVPRPDARDCALTRTSGHAVHGMLITGNAPAEIVGVLREMLSLAGGRALAGFGAEASAELRFPSAGQVNSAMARSSEYHGTRVTRMAGCFPLISEDDVQDSARPSWYCAAEGNPVADGASFLEFAIAENPRNGAFEMLVGELGAACPPGVDIRHEAMRLVSRPEVTGLFAEKRPFLGELGRTPNGGIDVACAYLGRLGPDNFQITLHFTFDRTGYHRTGRPSEEVFDDLGNLVK